jgi:signal peptidase I
MRTARTATVLFWSLLIVLAVLVSITRLLPVLNGWQGVSLTGQSMAGTYEMGTLIYVDSSIPPAVDAVVTFDYQNRLWTHRIIEKTHSLRSFAETRWQTMGDNMDTPDPFTIEPSQIRGTVVGAVPLIGYADLYLRTPLAWMSIILIGGLLHLLSQKGKESPIERMKRRLATFAGPTGQTCPGCTMTLHHGSHKPPPGKAF